MVSSTSSKLGSDWSLNKPDCMGDSVTGRSEGDSTDTGIYSMSASMPSSMISSNSMALSFAAEMDSSGFFSDLETGRMSGVEVEMASKHQISPITENSEPDSSGSPGESRATNPDQHQVGSERGREGVREDQLFRNPVRRIVNWLNIEANLFKPDFQLLAETERIIMMLPGYKISLLPQISFIK